jgi:hypothetical protein
LHIRDLVDLQKVDSRTIGPFLVVELGDKIESVPNDFLRGAKQLRSVRLPSSLTSMGDSAFANSSVNEIDMSRCTKLKTIGECFLSWSSIASIDLSGCVELESLPDQFLRGTRQLRSVRLPSSLTSIGDDAFMYSLVNEIDMSLCTEVRALGNCFLMGSAIASIDLSGCVEVESVPDHFLRGTRQLRSVRLPSSLTSIGNYAFERSSVNEVDMSRCTKLRNIGTSFLSWSAIVSIDLSACVELESVADNFMRETNELRSVCLPATTQRPAVMNQLLMWTSRTGVVVRCAS